MFGLKFSSKSKLFGGCHPCSRTTSATLIQTTTLPRYIEQVGKWKEVGSEKLTCIDACKRQENKIFVSESLFPSRVRQV